MRNRRVHGEIAIALAVGFESERGEVFRERQRRVERDGGAAVVVFEMARQNRAAGITSVDRRVLDSDLVAEEKEREIA